MSKKEQLLKAGSKIQNREEKPTLEKEAMAGKLKSPVSKYKKVLFTLEYPDIEVLDEIVSKVNQQTKRKTSKSELVRVGISLLKNKTSYEIIGILKNM